MNLSHSVPPSSNNLDAQPDAAHADVADAARELGLKPIRAWVPDQTQKTNRTGGAQRAKRCREKAEQHGFKQLSRVFPVELHPFLSTLSTRTKAGDPAEVVLAELLKTLNKTASTASSSKNTQELAVPARTLQQALQPPHKGLPSAAILPPARLMTTLDRLRAWWQRVLGCFMPSSTKAPSQLSETSPLVSDEESLKQR